MDNKAKYREFAKEQKNLPIFSQPWWLDTVAPDSWDVAIVEKNGQIVASMPYVIQKRYGFIRLGMPPLTQKLGPYIVYPPKQSYYKRLSYQTEIIGHLLEQLPKYDFFSQTLDYELTNLLPFHWRGFETRVRVTYTIDPMNKDEILKNMIKSTRGTIKKAYKTGITIKVNSDVKQLYSLIKDTFERKGKKFPVAEQLLDSLHKEISKRNSGLLLFAVDERNNVHSGIYLVWDNRSYYYLLGGSDNRFRSSGAVSLLILRGIEMASEEGKIFDFEGSMNMSIERFFRSFGAKQKHLYNVYRARNKFLELLRCLKPGLI